MIKPKFINRKFYNKWCYKICLKIPGITVFRMYSLGDLHDLFETHQKDGNWRTSFIDTAIINKDTIEPLAELLLTYDKDAWSKRIERNTIDLYTNDELIYNEISEKFKLVTLQRFEPSPGRKDLYDESSIVVEKYPHNRYKYKVFLLPHKMKGDVESKKKYIEWVCANPAVLISEAVQHWFIKTDWNWDRRYVLVEDENNLLMLKLRNSEVVGRIYKYVIADK